MTPSVLRSVRPRRVAVLSVHTSPLEQPGTGDAGGMNVYVLETSKRLAALGVEVEVFTRATRGDLPPVVDVVDGVRVHHVTAGPLEGLGKDDLPSQLCALTSGVLRAEARHEPGWYDVVHSHYWLSGQVGWLAKERWGVPLVHTAHTLAKVKNLALAQDDLPEPLRRVVGEEQVVAASDRLVANTREEARQLVDLYDAEAERVVTVNPGVDLEHFRPGTASTARTRLGVPPDAVVLLFVGRLQPLKGPDVLLRAAARLLERDPSLRERLVVAVVGGPSGNGQATSTSQGEPAVLRALAASLDLPVRFAPPADPQRPARLVPRGRPGGRAQPQRVVRPGRPGGAGLRHPGRGHRRRRAAHDRPGRCQRPAGAGPRPAGVGRGAGPRPAAAARAVPRRRGARAAVLLGRHRPRAARHLPQRALRRARRPAGGGAVSASLPPGVVPASGPAEVIRAALDDAELSYTTPGEGQFFVTLPGTHKLATNCWLVVGAHALLVEAFVCRRPDENAEEFFRFLLRRNARTYAVSFSLDRAGDVYLVGRLPLASVSAEEVDRVLGAVLQYADESFDPLLELGFASSIRREWAWRTKNGESTANLQAFARFADPDR